MDITIESLDQLKSELREKIGGLVYFSTPQCNVCKVLRPKIMDEFEKNFPDVGRYYVDSTITPEVSAAYNVFAVPTILVFLDGKEFARESRNVSVGGLINKISRPYDIMTS